MTPERKCRTPRSSVVRVALAASLVLSAGCATFGKRDIPPPAPPEKPLDRTPTAADLVGYLNRNAAKLPAVEATDLDIDIKAGRQEFGLSGSMFVQQPKNFRLVCKQTIMGEVADIGSNEREFWYWIRQDNPPYLYHCSHADLARGVRLPFPVQPEWVMEAFGLARHDPTDLANHRVEVRGDSIELIEQAISPQGERVQKVTVFKNFYVESGSAPNIVGMKLLDAGGKTQCVATIESVHRFQMAGDPHPAVLPHKVKLEWPAYQMSLRLQLPANGLKINGASQVIATRQQLFERPVKKDVKSYDLARQAVDAPAGLQRTAGFGR